MRVLYIHLIFSAPLPSRGRGEVARKIGGSGAENAHVCTIYTLDISAFSAPLPPSQIPSTSTQCKTLYPNATHCNTLQHTATHCNPRHLPSVNFPQHQTHGISCTRTLTHPHPPPPPPVHTLIYSLSHTHTHAHTHTHTHTHHRYCWAPRRSVRSK